MNSPLLSFNTKGDGRGSLGKESVLGDPGGAFSFHPRFYARNTHVLLLWFQKVFVSREYGHSSSALFPYFTTELQCRPRDQGPKVCPKYRVKGDYAGLSRFIEITPELRKNREETTTLNHEKIWDAVGSS